MDEYKLKSCLKLLFQKEINVIAKKNKKQNKQRKSGKQLLLFRVKKACENC